MSSIDVLYSALNGLMTQQQAISDNIANVSTPGYQAKQVDFETALQNALSNGGSVPSDTAAVTLSTAAPDQNGNNVDLNQQTVAAADNSLQYQTVIDALNAKFSILKTSIGG